MRIAVIDLGTNTFNLLIVDISENNLLQYLYNKKIPAKLGKGGINNKIITKEAFERGISALKEQKKIIEQYNCIKTYAIGTSALRNANNSIEFVKKVKEETDIDIIIISGDQEAELIYKGNIWATQINYKALILDIGGGSNEFIIGDKNKIYWKQSFEIGMQRLIQKFNPSFPMSENEQKDICNYIDSQLSPLYEAIKQYPIHTIIGSSGSFDTLRNILEIEDSDDSFESNYYQIEIQDFKQLFSKIISLSYDDLALTKGIDISRVEFLPTATLFINFIIDKFEIKKIIQSAYSLKEGFVYQLIDKK